MDEVIAEPVYRENARKMSAVIQNLNGPGLHGGHHRRRIRSSRFAIRNGLTCVPNPAIGLEDERFVGEGQSAVEGCVRRVHIAVRLLDVKPARCTARPLHPPAVELIGPAGSVQNFV